MTRKIIKFSGEWCGPCRTVKPLIEKLALEYGAELQNVDIDDPNNSDIINFYKIRSLPTIVISGPGGETITTGVKTEDQYRIMMDEAFN